MIRKAVCTRSRLWGGRHEGWSETSTHHPRSRRMVAGKDGANPTVLASFREPEAVAGIFYGGPTWSPDGQSIVTAVVRGRPGLEQRAWLASVEVEGGRVSKLADPGWLEVSQSQFLPDGKALLVIARSPEQTNQQLWNTQLWKVSLPGGEARTLTTDLNDHRIVSLTRDGKTLASITGDVSAKVWSTSVREPGRSLRLSRKRQDGIYGVVYGEKGQAIYTSLAAGLWSLWSAQPDGSDLRVLVTGAPGEALQDPSCTAAGDLYFTSQSADGGAQLKVLKKGATVAQALARLTSADGLSGGSERSRCNVSRDGRFVVYGKETAGRSRLYRKEVQTGEERMLIDLPAERPSIDPSGTRVAFYFTTPEERFRFGVCSADGGPLLLELPAAPSVTWSSHLVLRREGLYINTVVGDRANVWYQPLDGKEAHRVTAYTDQLRLYSFALSDDGDTLLVSRGPRVRDAQLITGF